MTWEEFIQYANNAAEVAGASGHTVGAAVEGYKGGRAGDDSKYRNINDIEVSAGIDDKTAETIKKTSSGLGFMAIAAAVIFFFAKIKK